MKGRIRGDLGEDQWPGTNRLKSYDEFREQLERRVYVDTAGFYGDPAAFRTTLKVFTASNVVFRDGFSL